MTTRGAVFSSFLRSKSNMVAGVSLAIAASAASCTHDTPITLPANAEKQASVATVREPVKSTPVLFDEQDLDRSANACEDFYQFACGGWIKRTEIPSDKTAWSRSFHEITKRNEEILRGILETLASDPQAATDDEQRKLGDFFASCMDEGKRETVSIDTLKARLTELDRIKDGKSLAMQVAKTHIQGPNVLFAFGNTQDAKDSSQMIGDADQSGLSLPGREYYLDKTEKKPEIRKLYVKHVETMLTLLGEDPKQSAQEAAAVMRIETALAQASMDRVLRRDPKNTYHRINRSGLEKLTPNFDWNTYFTEIGYPNVKEMNVSSPNFFKSLNSLLKKTSLTDLRTYIKWHILTDSANELSSKFENEDFNFFSKTLMGQTEITPRWKRCVASTSQALNHPLNKIYVAKTFGGESKDRAQEMIKAIEATMEEKLQTLSWMDDKTRVQAKEKLSKVYNQIGYPDKWRDFSELKVDRGAFLANTWAANTFNGHYYLDKIGKPVDRNEWYMPASLVNAYYSADNNQMVFPAGILQEPFFDRSFPDQVNYGAIGMVMSHELTHGFDDQGRKYDSTGNLRDWWTKKVAKEFDDRASCLVKQYSSYKVLDTIPVNGKLTLGENIADQGGIKLAYSAWEKKTGGKGDKIAGFDPSQQFFLSFAQSWCSKQKPETQRHLVIADPHSPAKYRVNGPLSNFDQFAKAFSCQPGTKMVPKKACSVW